MIDRSENQFLWLDYALAALSVLAYGVMFAGITLILGFGITASIVIGLAGGLFVHRQIARSEDANRAKRAARAEANRMEWLDSRPHNPFAGIK